MQSTEEQPKDFPAKAQLTARELKLQGAKAARKNAYSAIHRIVYDNILAYLVL